MDMSKTIGVYTPLIDFSLILDIDFGILNLIDRKYLDRDTFSVDWFNKHHKINKMVEALVTREHWNPLNLCSLKSEEENESLYFEFIAKPEYYKEVIELSMVTEIYNLIEKFNLSGDIQTTVYCESELEVEALKSLNATKKLNVLLDPKPIELVKYNQIYIKDTKSRSLAALVSQNCKNKSIYIANYPFNKDGEHPAANSIKQDEYIAALEIYRNLLRIIDVYDINKLKGDNNNG